MIDKDYSSLNAYYMEESTPSETPEAGWVLLYFKTDGKLYSKNSSGTEKLEGLSGAGNVIYEQILTDIDYELILIDNGNILYDTGITT